MRPCRRDSIAPRSLVIADHGMEQSDPAVDRDWATELAASGVAHRDVGGGLIWVD